MSPPFDESLVSAAHELGPMIREHATEAERQRRMSKPVFRLWNGPGSRRCSSPRPSEGWRATR
jgi:hypothetical protein